MNTTGRTTAATTVRSLTDLAADVASALARPVLHTGWGYASGAFARRVVVPLLLLELLTDEDEAVSA